MVKKYLLIIPSFFFIIFVVYATIKTNDDQRIISKTSGSENSVIENPITDIKSEDKSMTPNPIVLETPITTETPTVQVENPILPTSPSATIETPVYTPPLVKENNDSDYENNHERNDD